MTMATNNPFGMFTDMAKADLITKSTKLASDVIDKYSADLKNVKLSEENLEKVAMLTLLGTVNTIQL